MPSADVSPPSHSESEAAPLTGSRPTTSSTLLLTSPFLLLFLGVVILFPLSSSSSSSGSEVTLLQHVHAAVMGGLEASASLFNGGASDAPPPRALGPVPEFPQFAATPASLAAAHAALHSRVNASCPTFVVGALDSLAGLGHRFTNMLMVMVAATVVNATYVHPHLDEKWDTPHMQPAERFVDTFFGMGDGEWNATGVAAAYPDALSHRYNLPRVDDTRGYNGAGPFGRPGNASLWTDAVVRVWGSPCGVVYSAGNNHWLTDLKSGTKAIVAPKFAASMAVKGRAPPLVWDPRDLNIAMHHRRGDMTPTPEAWFAALLNATLLPLLHELMDWDAGVPVRFHVFSNVGSGELWNVAGEFPALSALPLLVEATPLYDGAVARIKQMAGWSSLTPTPTLQPLRPIEIIRGSGGGGVLQPNGPARGHGGRHPNISLAFHIGLAGLPALPTLYHCTQADMFVGSRSSFSEVAALISHVPLCFAQGGNKYGPGSQFPKWEYDHCGPYAVCCNGTSGECPGGARARVAALLERRGLLRRGVEAARAAPSASPYVSPPAPN